MLFLTYAQVDKSKFHWKLIVDRVHKNGGVCRIGEEHHKDGGLHYHVYAEKTNDPRTGKMRFFDTRSVTFWDFEGHHPNIKPVTGTHWKVWKYVAKEKLVHDEIPKRPNPMSRKRETDDEVFARALHSSTDQDSFLQAIRKIRPRLFHTSFHSINAAAKYNYPRQTGFVIDDPDCVLQLENYPELQQWIATELPNYGRPKEQPAECGGIQETASSISSEPPPSIFSADDSRESTPMESWSSSASSACGEEVTQRYGPPTPPIEARANKRQSRVKSLIMWGPSQLGKSIAARKFGEYCIMSGKFNLRDFDAGCEYLIMDDFGSGFRGFDYKLWFQGAGCIDCTDRYMPTTRLRWGRPCIFICNRDPLANAPREIETEWIEANCVIVNVTTPIIDIANQ